MSQASLAEGRRQPAATARLAALRTVQIEQDALQALGLALEGELGAAFDAAVDAIRGAAGRVFVSGIGKSGHIARKIGSTLASTGTISAFIHPAEASHGDLGMITPDDVILALSWSGETAELADLTLYARRYAVKLIAMTSRPESTLARAADIHLALPLVLEACPHNLAPTSSSLIQLALGDALAMALLEARGFSATDFREFHPGGTLAGRLKTVRQLMHTGPEAPLVQADLSMSDALLAIVGKRFGCAGVLGPDGSLIGIVTDGDLRRHMSPDILNRRVAAVMTRNPVTLGPDVLAAAALELMNRRQITAIFVVEGERPIGILHIHDLLRGGIA